ncbi:MAG: InlB B-repeat-containing protein, partial [Acholeplasmatales bacterium]|nr:InlB B-repeat-containing protein [Acholeplasmatales bacterium]
MKKRKILLGVLLATAIFTSASCDGPDKDSDGTKDVVTEQFTVTFDSKGGSAVESQTVNKDAKATQPTAPTKTATAAETYTFAGWYKDDACTQAFDFNTGITE